MKIACIGWGSLIWDQRKLKTIGDWHKDGPLLPIELARQSQDGRITFVLEENSECVTTLWALMDTNDLNKAMESLRVREGTVSRHIHNINVDEQPEKYFQKNIVKWLGNKGLDIAIWTGLPPKFDGQDNVVPTSEQLIYYFKNLESDVFEKAKEYIVKAPLQIKTTYRKELSERYF